MSEARFIVGDVFEKIADIPDGSVDLIVTSPPFLALRSYLPADHPDKHKEIGSEATPAAFLSTLLALTREWRRLLAPHGSLCVELGDTYSGSGGDQHGDNAGNGRYPEARDKPHRQSRGWPLDKSLCLIPTSYAWALAYGHNPFNPDDRLEPWRIRNQIVWHRPNPPVGGLGDKVRPSTSYITVACTSRTRWFDLDAERTELTSWRANTPDGRSEGERSGRVLMTNTGGSRRDDGQPSAGGCNPAGAPPLDCWQDTTTEDVWTIPTAPYKGAHYATFPITLPRKLINLMCPRQVCTTCGEPRRRITGEPKYVSTNGGRVVNQFAGQKRSDGRATGDYATQWTVPGGNPGHAVRVTETLGWSDCGHNTWRRGLVLDPFCGSGTTLVAASELGRDSIGIDIDSRNLDLARQRLGMFLVEEDEVAL